MNAQPSRNKFVYILYFFLITAMCLSIFGMECHRDPNPGPGIEIATPNCEDKGSSLQLDCPALPNTNLTAQPDFDIFAWNSFIALNWPALVDTTQLQRGIPNLGNSFKTAQHNDVLVWETYKEKREVFNVPQATTQSLPPWNNFPIYDADGLRAGDNGSSYIPGALPGSSTAPKGIIFNTLDETIEVKSESLEGDSDSNPVYGLVVSPRVWRGQPSAGNPVLYEVKVNYDFYNYVNENKFFIDKNASNAANSSKGPGIRLPYRTSANEGPPPGGTSDFKVATSGKEARLEASPDTNTNNTDRVLKYSAKSVLSQFQTVNTTPNPSVNPPLEGAVHIKAAWIQLVASDDTSAYHTTTAEYYETGSNGTVERRYATFGLIGLHIIQRVHLGDLGDPTAQQRGGTFIFATWEHLSVNSGYTYSNYKTYQGFPSNIGWYPHKGQPIIVDTTGLSPDTTFLNPATYPVTRKYPILSSTAAVTQQVWDSLPTNSVWRNYQLIGTQFQAIESVASDTLGQPRYLANLVIETNEGLQHFQGQPPLTTTINNFSSQGVVSNTANAFARNNKNVLSGGAAINMGGCMGCHGVAQSEGYSFSFVLLGGHAGATTDTDSLFDLPPPPLNVTSN